MDPNNWDLQAVVRGCCFTDTTAAATVDPFFSVPNPLLPKEGEQVHGDEEVLLTSFPELSATRTALYELEELCSPFNLTTVRHPPPPPQQQQSVHLSSSSAAATTASRAPHLPQQPRQPHRPQSQISRSKRRKSQLKKVVRQVPADGVSSDMWAWRKYGQKPIKGSPHPRGYYRCSSSKGCPARKQVERSVAEPGMLVITYTAEHNHPVPTHLNSLAGSTRHKLPPPPSSAASALGGGGERERLLPRIDRSSSPLSTLDGAVLSPITPLTSSVEDERLCRWWRRPCKGEEGDVEEDEEDQPLTVGDMGMIGEDDMLFTGLEGFGGRTAVAATYQSAAVSVGPDFLEDGNGFAGRFFPCTDPMRCPVP